MIGSKFLLIFHCFVVDGEYMRFVVVDILKYPLNNPFFKIVISPFKSSLFRVCFSCMGLIW